MPDIYTHILNGRESLKRLGKYENYVMNNYINLFYLGCMGPDIFLYHNYYPWSGNKAVRKLGGKMHNYHCGEVILEALRHIKETIKSGVVFDNRSIYFLGYICHYAADRTAHPYIFSRSGIYDKSKLETYKYKNSHKVMELAIDYHLAKRLDNDDINYLRMDRFIDLGDRMPEQVIDLYKYLLDIYFKEDVIELNSDFIDESYSYIKKAWKLFYDPTFIKRYLLKALGYEAFFYPIDPYKRDYMNEKRVSWTHPCDCNVISTKTFYEIFNESVILSSCLLNTALDYLVDKIDIEEAKKIIGNFSFTSNMDSGKTCAEMKYFNPIF